MTSLRLCAKIVQKLWLDRSYWDSVGRWPRKSTWPATIEAMTTSGASGGVLTALEKAAQRKEPSAAYVMAHPLFRYLANDPRFLALKVKLTAQQAEIRTALASMR